MLFSSLVFLFTFLPITLLVYYLVPRKVKNVVLLIASLIFYAWGEPVYIFLMLISILFNYFCGMDIALKAGRKSQVRSLIFTIVVNLFILGFFKYYGFIVTNLNAILPFYIPYRKLELPIGISFYTFQTLSYIIDVYRGNVDVQVNLIDFGTYVTMFPQLIAGPIVQYADVERQLRERKESLTKFGYGAWFFVIGLAKKVLLANTIGSIYENIAAMDGMSVVTAWLGCLAYTFQIYFDFSGYSDMAVGLGKMFGFEFMQNFNYPYISTSIREFWRRWHVTLGNWFKDYVFYPISISKFSLDLNKKARKRFGNEFGRIVSSAIPILAVWLLTGIWHGPDWKYVTWGLFHGILIMLSMIFTPYNEKLVQKLHIKTECFSFRLFQMGRTFLLCCLGRVFFRADDFASAIGILKRACTGIGWYRLANGRIYNYGLNKANMTVVIVAMLVLLTVSILQEKMDVLEALKKQNLVFRWVLIYALLLAVVIFGMYGPGYDPSAFIYEKF